MNQLGLPPGLFITATGTGSGKTFVTRGLAAALTARGQKVAAIKPIETGLPEAASITDSALPEAASITDAALLARACAQPQLADAPGLYRAAVPAAPYAVSLATGAATPSLVQLATAIATAALGSELVLVEGAGGLLVPLDREHTIADLIAALGLPIVLVAPNALGVLSHALTAAESAERRNLQVAALILTDLSPAADLSDPSRPHNAAILRERLPFPVLSFPYCADPSDAALARAASSANLLSLL
jgi:dethiobiotin synthetase